MDKEFDDLLNDIIEDRFYRKIVSFIEQLSVNGRKISLYKIQIELIKFLFDNKNEKEIFINKSRQCGVTTIINAFILYKILRENDKYIVCLVSNSYATSADNLDKFKDFCSSINIKTRTSSYQILINGNLVTNHLRNIKNHISDDKKLIVLYDEYAHIDPKRLRDVNNSIFHYTNNKNVMRIYASSPNGLNSFHDKFNDESIPKFTINWKDVPGRNDIWRKRTIASLGDEKAFEQEYNNKFIA